MRKLVIVVTAIAVALVLAAFAIALSGHIPTNANAIPPKLEIRIATAALDAAMNHHAPRVRNPIEPTDRNLIAGMKVYTANCSMCHGTLDMKESPLTHSFYPPVPQLILDPLDDPEWRTNYVIRTGVRYTGMPAWSGSLSEQDIWKVTAFLSHVDTLPAEARQYWSDAFGVDPPQRGSQRGPAKENMQHK